MNVMLNYSFIFNPEDTWRSRADFDKSLAEIFKNSGFNAVEVETGSQEDEFRRKVVILSPIPQDDITEKNKAYVGMQKIKARMTKKRGYDGKFRKING